MSYFVTVTFDLKRAKDSPHGKGVYAKITKALDQIDYSKLVNGKKETAHQLPHNTYVAEFEKKFNNRDEVIELVRTELREIFRHYEVSGKYFISVGKGWKWKVGSFKAKASPTPDA